MTDDAKKFIDYLDEAGQLLKDYPVQSHSHGDQALGYTPPATFNLALFENWRELYAPGFQQPFPIRVIQHLSCTGGTLICKCLSGLPNVTLLSEANPRGRLHLHTYPRFAPTDMTYLALLSKVPLIDDLSEKIFKADIDVITEHVRQLGRYLVIREHSHTDFFVGESPIGFSTVKRLLKDRYPVLPVVTIRNPVDSYLSLLNNGWIHFSPATFDEYCRRYLLFMEHNEGVPVYKYEDFVSHPQRQMKLLCETLDLPFNEDFEDVFDINIMTGDSGRSSNIIERRKRRAPSDSFIKELGASKHYQRLCEMTGYDVFTG